MEATASSSAGSQAMLDAASFMIREQSNALELRGLGFQIAPDAAKYRRMLRANVVARGGRHDVIVELLAERELRNLRDGNRLGWEVNQIKIVRHRGFKVFPEAQQAIELEDSTRVDLVDFMVLQKIMNDVFLDS